MNYMVKASMGMVPGGVYAGLMHIPGDPDGEWVQGEERESCGACEKGTLYYYWQEDNFHVKCNVCKYLHDAGFRWNEEKYGPMPEPSTSTYLGVE